MNLKKINRALISISDKSELTIILKILKKFKVEILSSGGTYKKINRLGYKSIEISNFTNSPPRTPFARNIGTPPGFFTPIFSAV